MGGTGSTHAGATRAGAPGPTGAGDAFDAGLLVAWLGGAGPAAARCAGCDAGARAVAG
ncbi:hypothetical protein ACVGVM_16580 [Pseudonocardia bannensis]|uniref:Carbohydrate kinase PfkB domain-containing protein n=1 Tax=Pseudonocardia bannensis TaxID=630973 RepID=A0A848DMK3_9PSEU|nr:hypothetical protein [Pseudonocardia bannensis]